MKAMNGIQIRAVLIALFAFYAAPILPLIALTSAPNFFGEPPAVGQRVPLWSSTGSFLLLWFWALAPVGSGYLAAKLAKQQPLLHGLLTGAVGGALVVLWVRGLWVFELVLGLLVVACGLFGGWLWRHRTQKQRVGP
jgi:hypothetical protein